MIRKKNMTPEQKKQRYRRIIIQLSDLLKATDDPISRMATISALLYHKMGHFFWIGFYRLKDGQLLVGPYQGTLACQKLAKDTGVCWACVNRNETVIVPDVEQFPGHIACDSRSKSEIVLPVRNPSGQVIAVLDADSDKLNMYDKADSEYLQVITDMVFAGSAE
jgi:GAF domain-containing protein